MKYINLTPHDINIIVDGENILTVPASGDIVRVESIRALNGSIDGINFYKYVWGEVQGLPDRTQNTIFIVSSMVLDRVSERDDVVAPADLVRDDKGVILGADGFKSHI